MNIPTEWEELFDWVKLDPESAADALANMQRQLRRHRAALKNLVGEVQWMSGSKDFGPGGEAETGWNSGTKRVLAECEALLDEAE